MDESSAKTWGFSLGYSLSIGMQRLYVLDSSELEFELEGPWKHGGHRQLSLAFVDPSLGGTGYLRRIAEEFDRVARTAIDHLDHPNCETACYRCLKSYRNQRHHEFLRWPVVMPHLEALAASVPVKRPEQSGDFNDPKPWLEAYSAGVGSPLELQFLRLFEKHGFHPEKQVPVSPTVGGAPISIADFGVAGRRLAIYIDGAAFHVGHNLRRDRYIRDKLRSSQPPWRVEEFTARDLAKGEVLVRNLMG
jgi:hypothetical protein